MPEQTNKLPENFDGTFPFTNYTDHDFVDYWNSVKYTFPAHSTVNLIIPDESPLGVQEIRKKFARNLAVKVFYDTDTYKIREGEAPMGSGKIPAIFTDADLAPYVQKCLEPLPKSQARLEKVEIDQTEKKMRRDSKGKRVTKVVQDGEDLMNGGQSLE